LKLEYLIYYFAFINLVGIIVNIADKIKAKHNKWRIRESTLWIIGILGGATGSYITMLLIRHKTKHKSFMLGMPVLALLNIAMLIYLFKICL